MTFKDWYAKNEERIKALARFSNHPIDLMEFAWDERGKLDKLKEENCQQKPKPGHRNICASCGTEIEYTINGYWQHTASNPRHIAQPHRAKP